MKIVSAVIIGLNTLILTDGRMVLCCVVSQRVCCEFPSLCWTEFDSVGHAKCQKNETYVTSMQEPHVVR